MVRQAIKLENYASLCFQLSTDSFLYPVLRCLAPFLQNEKEAGKQLAFQRVCFAEYLQKHASLDMLVFFFFFFFSLFQLPVEKMALDYFQQS